MLKKYVIVGVIFILILVTFPLISAGEEYPVEEGPYIIYLVGPSDGYGYSQAKFHIGPIWWIEGPRSLILNTNFGCRIIINGKLIALHDDYVVDLEGFKGLGPGFLFHIKPAIFRTRAIGICDAVILEQK